MEELCAPAGYFGVLYAFFGTSSSVLKSVLRPRKLVIVVIQIVKLVLYAIILSRFSDDDDLQVTSSV